MLDNLNTCVIMHKTVPQKKGWKCKLHDQENMIYDWTMQFVSFKS